MNDGVEKYVPCTVDEIENVPDGIEVGNVTAALNAPTLADATRVVKVVP